MSRASGCSRPLIGKWLGCRPYAPVHELQHALHAARSQGRIADTVLCLEHEPVITQGRGAKAAHLLASSATLEARGVELLETGRGGDVTLHAPGQLVCYPIIDLAPDRRDVRRYVNDLARVMCRLTEDFGISSGLVDTLIGVWVDRTNPSVWNGAERAANLAKIGAIGVRISRWITMHGFALNVAMDMSLFDLIVPCGIREHGVVSVELLTGERPALRGMAAKALEAMGAIMDRDIEGIEDCSALEIDELWPAPA